MRLAAPLLVLCTSSARADVDDMQLHALPSLSAGIGIAAHGGKLAGIDETGWGPNLELAIGSGRWQIFGEAGVARVKLGPEGDRTAGTQLRGGLGIRWLARSFELGRDGSIDMHLEAFSGMSRFGFEDMGKLVRPDLGVGVGYAIRGFFGRRFQHQAALRISARIYFAPTDRRDEEIACRGSCPMTDGNTNSGLMAVFTGAY